METDLNELQVAELEVFRKIIELCSAHKLSYYAVGGTLLGAVRHKGFIPWDDDIDIALPRPDYEKFLIAAQQEWEEPYHLNVIGNSSKGRIYYFAKAENRSVLLEQYARKAKMRTPVWVDVFPFDGAPENAEETEKWLKKGRKLYNLLSISQYSYRAADDLSSKPWNTMFYSLKLDRLLSTKMIWRLLDKTAKKYDYDSSRLICNFCGRYGNKEIVEKSVLGKGCLLPFESLEINCPEDYDAYLTHIYGDYMILPPESQRIRHKVKIVHEKLIETN